MGDLGAIHEDVDFDFAGATRLAGEFRSAAVLLDSQSGERPGLARGARAEWRGTYGDQFDQRVGVCVADGRTIAGAFRRAADGLDALAQAAREEQQRREAAREWERNNDDSGFGEGVRDFFLGEDDIPPPPPPRDPPRIAVAAGVAGSR